MESVKPAEVSILAIYNPSFGQKDENLHDQILYYYASAAAPSPHDAKTASDAPSEERERAERNERLRQIGLAQGLVEFGKFVAAAAPDARVLHVRL